MNRQEVQEAIDSLDHALMHVKQGEAEHARRPLNTAIHKLRHAILSDIVCASVAAVDDESAVGNIIVGVTAHCRCGHSFCDDVRAGYQKSK